MIKNYNPDVLSCLANLSSDEVFTPPNIANQMLDLLPASLWRDPNATFLDPACKSGVFLREIAKRLLKGLEEAIPDRQERINHIMTRQLYGKYSVVEGFADEQGNIRFQRTEHTWRDGRCIWCGAGQSEYARGAELESHAYEFIHVQDPKEIFDMQFDVIIGNPPYQLSDAGDSTGSSPIYHRFVEQAKKLSPRYLTMIIPSRWFAGGKNLDQFRDTMLNDKRISHLIDYPIASDVFPGVKIIGGVCYFLWERDYSGDCTVTTNMNGYADTLSRSLNEFDTFVRFNKAISILEKVTSKNYPSLSSQVSTQKPFGLRTYVLPTGKGNVTLYANKNVGKIEESQITRNLELVNKWKVLISRAYGEGGEARDYPRMILGKPIVAPPPSACTETYIVVGAYDTAKESFNLAAYIRSKFFRFLVGLRKNTQDIVRERFVFVPLLPMDQEWTDEKLYRHFGLSKEEIAFIESMVRPMPADNGDTGEESGDE